MKDALVSDYFKLNKQSLSAGVAKDQLNSSYNMAGACSRYNARSDWLSAGPFISRNTHGRPKKN